MIAIIIIKKNQNLYGHFKKIKYNLTITIIPQTKMQKQIKVIKLMMINKIFKTKILQI